MKKLIVFTLVALSVFSPVSIAGTCQQFFRAKHVIRSHHVVAAPIHHAVAAVPIYYGVGPQLQQQAISTKQIESIVAAAVQAALATANHGAYSSQSQSQSQPQVSPAPPASAITQHCSGCHGATPKGNSLTLDVALGIPCEVITESLRKIRDGEMPKGHKLTPEQMGAVMDELLNAQAG